MKISGKDYSQRSWHLDHYFLVAFALLENLVDNA